MSEPRKKYDSTIARIAGNIASGLVKNHGIYDERAVAEEAVQLARLIIAEVERTEPTATTPVMPINNLLAAAIEQMADGHYRRGLGGPTGAEVVRRDWFKLAETVRAENTKENGTPPRGQYR